MYHQAEPEGCLFERVDGVSIHEGVDLTGVTVVYGSEATQWARTQAFLRMSSGRVVWFHTMQTRPFFQECLALWRVQTTEEEALDQLVLEFGMTSALLIFQLTQKMPRIRCQEILFAASKSQAPIVILAKEREWFWGDHSVQYIHLGAEK